MNNPEPITVSLEDWLPVVGYQGFYEVSSLGRIKSLSSGKTLSQNSNSTGYPISNLSKNGYVKHFLTHRLVAQAFLENPKNLKCVNHIDGKRTNNKLDNLEWCTHSENNRHAYKIGTKKVDVAHMQMMQEKAKNRKWKYSQGVKWIKNQNKWQAYIVKDYKVKHLGFFKDKANAIAARKEACNLYNSLYRI